MLKFESKAGTKPQPAPVSKPSPAPVLAPSPVSAPVFELPPAPPLSLAPKESKPAKKPHGLIERIKKIKNIEIYAAVAIILVMVVIYISTLSPSSFSNNSSGSSTRTNEDEYARELEAKLNSVLSQIKGAGRVEVMVTVVGSATMEIAYNIDEKTITQEGAGGSSTTTTTIVKTPVIINGRDGPQPLIIFEIKPKLKGVVVVAAGANDIGVRLQLLRAVQTVVADKDVNIEIFAGKA